MAYVTENRAIALNLNDRVHAIMENLKDAAAKRKVYRATIRELNELSNGELADIGLNRASIRAAAYEAAYHG